MTGPPHGEDLLIVLDSSRLGHDVVKLSIVDRQPSEQVCFRDLSLKLRVTIHTFIDEDSCACAWSTLVPEVGLKLIDKFDIKPRVLRRIVLFGKHGHPDLAQVAKVGNKQDGTLALKV